MTEYRLEPLRPELFDELSPLMFDAFGESVGPDFFRWKFVDNPAGPAIGNIARNIDDGEIAAFYGMIPERYRWGSEIRTVYQSCDTMTHARHRRRGLFQKLALETYRQGRERDPDFLAIGFGGPTSTPGFLKMGWTAPFDIRFRFRPYPLTLVPVLRPRPVEGMSTSDETLISLICSAAEQRPLGAVRTRDFIRWRLANPLRKYEAVVDGDRAYAIYYRSAGSLFLFDFWEREARAGHSAWNAVRNVSLRPRTKGVLTFCQSGIDFDDRVRRLGFYRNPWRSGPASLRTPFIVYGKPGDRGSASDWAITPFDHDSY